jgi:arginyl-tRNA synthetase
MITGDVRRAIARAVAAEGLPPAEPGLRPAGGPGRYGSSVAFAYGEQRLPAAARIAARLAPSGGIARAEVTGPGFITITIDPNELAALPDRIAAAGPGCAASDALAGTVVPAPPEGDPLAEKTWEKASAALAAQLTARLAAAAGATVAAPEDMERSVSPPDREALAVSGEATVRYSAILAQPFAGPRSPETEMTPTAAAVDSGTPAQLANDPRPPATGLARTAAVADRRDGPGVNPVATAVAWAGADAVRFALARAVPGRPPAIEPAIIARHVMSNPAYAVRYAHARAASGVRWAATGSQAAAALRHRPADPGELVLLDALSWLPERVAAAARRGRPDEFARYLEELASATIAALIETGHPGNTRAPTDRLAIARAARTGLAAGLGLLGVDAPDRL